MAIFTIMLKASCGWMFILAAVLKTEGYDYTVTPENSSECTNDCVKDTMKEVSQRCFNTTLSDSWDVFAQDGVLDCTSIRRVLTILSSCENCGPYTTSFNWMECHQKQRIACVHGKYCETYCTPFKERGVTSCIEKQATRYKPIEASTWPRTDPTLSPDAKAKKDKIRPCDACASGNMSSGVAALLFLLGLALGVMVKAALCFCLPCCHRLSTKTRTRLQTTFPHLKDINETPKEPSTEGTSNAVASGNHVASSGLSSPTYRAGYQTMLTNQQNNRNSHTYTGIQPESLDQGEIYTEPTGVDGTYQQPTNGPLTGVKAVQSPVYNQFTNGDIVPSARIAPSALNAYQTLNAARDTESPHRYGVISSNNQFKFEISNGPIKEQLGNEGTNNQNLNYTTSQSNGQRPDSNETNVEDHSYFVLEKGASQVDLVASGNEPVDTAEVPKHDYFVLEKQ